MTHQTSGRDRSGPARIFTGPRLGAVILGRRLTFNGTLVETGTDSCRLAGTRAPAERPAPAG
jgi:hypothetical protein